MFLAVFAKKHLINNRVGDAIVNAIRIRAIDEKLYIPAGLLQYHREKKSPSVEMLKSKEFFERNTDAIQNNIKLLHDTESKECYEKAIKYRYTHDMSNRPIYTRDIYFVKGIIEISPVEVFVDGGAFVGDTVRKLKRISHNRFKKIICFEPDTYNYKMLGRITDSRIKTINKGLSDQNKELTFFNNGSVGSRVLDDNEKDIDKSKISSIRVVAIDEVDECRDATFIKMDIEGAELSALKGAVDTIKRNKPKLAICLYHSDEDMLSIIEYVHALVPEYKLYVRQHSLFAAETVLYACI